MPRRIVLNEVPDERPVAEVIAEIRQLYFKTTATTIDRDFDRAIDLLKSIGCRKIASAPPSSWKGSPR